MREPKLAADVVALVALKKLSDAVCAAVGCAVAVGAPLAVDCGVCERVYGPCCINHSLNVHDQFWLARRLLAGHIVCEMGECL